MLDDVDEQASSNKAYKSPRYSTGTITQWNKRKNCGFVAYTEGSSVGSTTKAAVLLLSNYIGDDLPEEGMEVSFEFDGLCIVNCREISTSSSLSRPLTLQHQNTIRAKEIDVITFTSSLESHIKIMSKPMSEQDTNVLSYLKCVEDFVNKKFKECCNDLEKHFKKTPDAREVLIDNYISALKLYTVNFKASSSTSSSSTIKFVLSLDIITNMHKTIGDKNIVTKNGVFRDVPVHVGSDRNFSRPNDVIAHLQTYIEDFNTMLYSRNDVDAANKAIWALYSFLKIHPFHDGNGRTARLLANIVLYHSGVPFHVCIVGNPTDRKLYNAAFKEPSSERSMQSLYRHLASKLSACWKEIDLSYATIAKSSLINLPTPIAQSQSKDTIDSTRELQRKHEDIEAAAIKKFRADMRQSPCMICFEESPTVTLLCCFQVVHLECMHHWLKDLRSKSRETTCPACRSVLAVKVIEQAVAAEPNTGVDYNTDSMDDTGSVFDTDTDTDTDTANTDSIANFLEAAFTEAMLQDTSSSTEDEDDTYGTNTEDTTVMRADDTNTSTSHNEDDVEVVSNAPGNDPVTLMCSSCERKQRASACTNMCCQPCCIEFGFELCPRHGKTELSNRWMTDVVEDDYDERTYSTDDQGEDDSRSDYSSSLPACSSVNNVEIRRGMCSKCEVKERAALCANSSCLHCCLRWGQNRCLRHNT